MSVLFNLAAHGSRTALVTPEGEISYTALASSVSRFGERLGSRRRLVLMTGANTAEAIIAYLGALHAGHVVLLAPSAPELIEAYDPDVVIRPGSVEERRTGSAHTLHPDLAMLLSTSGSTGSAKLVRLSHTNLRSNAESIASYLQLTADDRAVTTLPMHYCYGLSVINSHLLRGASLVLTERSVTEPEFWETVRSTGCTSFAGVPHTFDLLDRVGFSEMDLPSLRYVTQAGGRLAPDRVRHYAKLGRRKGFDFYVMYGQTEATARMAYLPPARALTDPHCVGVAVAGGSFDIDPETSELIYHGPNVMLGYASGPADLAHGRTVHSLLTGDLARRTPQGLVEIVGRCNRFAKVFGLRIDLELVEQKLATQGITASCLDDDGKIAVVTTGEPKHTRVLAAKACQLPARAVSVHRVTALPRLSSGKPDYQAMRALLHPSGQAAGTDLAALFAEVFELETVPEDSSFVSLGGDSLSYVEMSVRLEEALGHLPPDWHTTSIKDLRALRRPHKRIAALDTGVFLRAVSIVLVVGTHSALFAVSGGAHLLLSVAGFNFARFHLTSAGHSARMQAIVRSVRRIALVSICWIAFAAAFISDAYGPAEIFLLHNFLNRGVFNDFWFIETIVYVLLGALGLLAIPWLDRLERRHPFAFPMAVMTAGLVTRYGLFAGAKLATPLVVIWLFALGWAAAKATSWQQRAVVTIAAAATIPGFHGHPLREAIMFAGLIALTWIPSIPSVTVVNRIAGVLAASSLYIYLTHWQVFPRLLDFPPIAGFAASLVVGVAATFVIGRVSSAVTLAYRRIKNGLHPRLTTLRHWN